METSSIFNWKRFAGLFGSGFNRKRGSFLRIFIWITLTMYALDFLLETVGKLEPELSNTVLSRLYQAGYIIALTILSLKGYANKEKVIAWVLLPASAFEKTLYRYIRTFVFGSIVYFAVVWVLDYIIGSDSEHLTFLDIIAIIPPTPTMPLWLNYTVFFLYCMLVPMIANLQFLDPFTNFISDYRQLVVPWCVLFIFQLTLNYPTASTYTEVERAGYIVVEVMAAFSFGVFIFTLLSSLIKSCRK